MCFGVAISPPECIWEVYVTLLATLQRKAAPTQAQYVETQQSKLSMLQICDINRLTLPFGARNAQSAQS